MKNKEKKLTEKEKKRLEIIMEKRANLEKDGYVCQEKIFSAFHMNVMGTLAMLPYIILMIALFAALNLSADTNWQSLRMRNYFPSYGLFMVSLIAAFAVLIVLHELIHGICFSCFVPGGWKSIDFGFNAAAFAPYCTCLEPLSKKAYIISALMPTIFLGFLPCIIASFLGNAFILLLGLTMIFGGAGDFLMVYNLIKIKTKDRDVLFIDHPTEIGSLIFIKEKL